MRKPSQEDPQGDLFEEMNRAVPWAALVTLLQPQSVWGCRHP